MLIFPFVHTVYIKSAKYSGTIGLCRRVRADEKTVKRAGMTLCHNRGVPVRLVLAFMVKCIQDSVTAKSKTNAHHCDISFLKKVKRPAGHTFKVRVRRRHIALVLSICRRVVEPKDCSEGHTFFCLSIRRVKREAFRHKTS